QIAEIGRALPAAFAGRGSDRERVPRRTNRADHADFASNRIPTESRADHPGCASRHAVRVAIRSSQDQTQEPVSLAQNTERCPDCDGRAERNMRKNLPTSDPWLRSTRDRTWDFRVSAELRAKRRPSVPGFVPPARDRNTSS